MSKKPTSERFDPLKAWHEWFTQGERQWSESLTEMMKQDSVAQAVGKEINAALYGQQMLTKNMAGPLGMMNLPTREDIMALGERLGSLEDSIARQEAMLVLLQGKLTNAKKPPRTRRVDAIKAKPEGSGGTD